MNDPQNDSEPLARLPNAPQPQAAEVVDDPSWTARSWDGTTWTAIAFDLDAPMFSVNDVVRMHEQRVAEVG